MEAYAKQAYVWDWDGYDNREEHEYWRQCAAKHGKNVLLPMCALGEADAYMARSGLRVVAFDITEEMIREAEKRFGSVDGLEFRVADIRAFSFPQAAFDFCYVTNQDLNLLKDANEVERALHSIHRHMRAGGCLVLELHIGGDESEVFPRRTFHPRVPNHPGKRVWKENECRYDGGEKRNYISQIVYVEDENGVERFDCSVSLQYFEREDVLRAIEGSGFRVAGEFRDRQREPWRPGDREWIVELVK